MYGYTAPQTQAIVPAPQAPAHVVQAPRPARQHEEPLVIFAIVALIACAVLGFLGYMWGRSGHPSWTQVNRAQQLAEMRGQIGGHDAGWKQGLQVGRNETKYAGQLAEAQGKQNGYSQGLQDGISTGQSIAASRYDGMYGPDLSTSSDDLGLSDPMSTLDDPTLGLSDPMLGSGSLGLSDPDANLYASSLTTPGLADGYGSLYGSSY